MPHDDPSPSPDGFVFPYETDWSAETEARLAAAQARQQAVKMLGIIMCAGLFTGALIVFARSYGFFNYILEAVARSTNWTELSLERRLLLGGAGGTMCLLAIIAAIMLYRSWRELQSMRICDR